MTGTPTAIGLDELLAEEPFVRSLARSLLFDEHQVDDVVQQTWMQALRRPPARLSPRAWLATVVRSQASNLRRGEARRRERQAAVAAQLPTDDEIREREQRRTEVVDAVLRLPEPYRSAVLLRYFEQLAPRVIAQKLGIPRDTVATRLKRGLRRLREDLDQRYGDRRAWCLALVPLAASPRAKAAGLLSTKAAGWLGVIWMTKNAIWLGLGMLLLVALSASLLWQPTDNAVLEGAGPAQVAASPVDSVEGATPPDPVPAAVVERSEAVPERAGPAAVPPLTDALAGFRGRLLQPDGTPAAGRQIRLLAVDSATAFGGCRDPLDPAPVVEAGIPSHLTRSAADGTFFVRGVWPGSVCMLHAGVDSAQQRFQVLSRTPGPAEIVDLGDIRLIAKGVVKGRVVDEDGAPVAGADVWAADLPAAILGAAPMERFGGDGALFLSLPEVAMAQRASHDAEAYARALKSHLATGVLKNVATAGHVVLELPDWAQRFWREWPRPLGRTDRTGRFELCGLESGASVLVVRHPRLAMARQQQVRIRDLEPVDLGDIVMTRGEELSGFVRDASGAALPHAEVRIARQPVFGLRGALFAGRVHHSDDRGAYAVTGLSRGELVVAVRRGAGDPWAFETDLDADVGTDLRVDDSAVLRLAMHGAADVPLEELTLSLVQGPPIGELSHGGMTPPLALDRRLEDLGDGRVLIRGLVAGTYTLHVGAAGHAPVTRVLDVSADAGEVAVQLRAEVACPIEVVDRTGRPVYGARVFAQPEPLPAWAYSVIYAAASDGFAAWDRLARFAGATDAAGHLDVRGLAAGSATLTVRHPRYGAVAEVVQLPSHHRFVLAETGAIRGRLFDGGKPAGADQWRLMALPVDEELASTMPRPVGHAAPGSDGSFEFRGLPPGKYVVRVQPSLADLGSLGALFEKLKSTYSWTFNSLRQEEVDVAPGRVATVEFDVDENRGLPGTPTGSLRGRITLDGMAPAGYSLCLGDGLDRNELVELRPDGGFELVGLRPQEMRLRLRSAESGLDALWRRDVTLTAGRDTVVEVDMRSGWLQGVVRDSHGAAAAACSVWAAGVLAGGDDQCTISTETDAGGRFKLRLPEGGFQLRISGSSGSCVSKGHAVRAGKTTEVTVELAPHGTFSGHVVFDAAAKPSAIMWLILERDRGQGDGWHMVRLDSEGEFSSTLLPGRYHIKIQGSNNDTWTAVPEVVDVPVEGLLHQVLRLRSN